MTSPATTGYSIVALDRFIQATRDSGYKGTGSAISELVDNALQADAAGIDILIRVDDSTPKNPIIVTVIDDGTGMDEAALRTALRFGGSSRFNDRGGLGRYGMGLPNSSLSQARRVTVHTWREPGNIISSYLDVDEIARGELTVVPRPAPAARPEFVNGHVSGTAVTWSRCDRLDNRRVSTISRKLRATLGRRFRHHLSGGTLIRINDKLVEPIDPLFVNPEALHSGAHIFGEVLRYEVASAPDTPQVTGIVEVRFSELPVAQWSALSNREKRARGIAKGSGVSVVRGGREVDYGWYFMGTKRRENYDDWWRCEVSFEPVLDEAFGITHTKQQIRPQPHLVEALAPDMESIARALCARARKAHNAVKLAARFNQSEEVARAKDELLTPLPTSSRERDAAVLQALPSRPESLPADGAAPDKGMRYRIVPRALNRTAFFDHARDHDGLALVLNPDHPFYRVVYRPLLDADGDHANQLRVQMDLLLLAAARAEALLDDAAALAVAEQLRQVWSDTLATFLTR